jgi:hypothetical protein
VARDRGTDRRGRLESDPFEAQLTSGGLVRISRGGRVVTTLGGVAGEKLMAAIGKADDRGVQLLLAKATGHYKH